MSGDQNSQSLSQLYGYPVPDTWISGQTVTADWLNRNIRDSQKFLAFAPLTILSRNASQSIPTGTNTAVTWDTEIVDTDNMISVPSSNITIQSPGVYSLQFNADYSANTTGARQIYITLNGNIVTQNGGFAASSNDTGLVCSTILALAPGDVIQGVCYQSSGSSLNLTTAPASTRMSIRLISTAQLDVTFSTVTPPSSSHPSKTPTKHTTTFKSTYSRTFDGSNATTWDDSKYCYQGLVDWQRGNTKSVVGFNFATIESTLAGATKMSGTFHFYPMHSYYGSGYTARIGSHNYASKPSTWNPSKAFSSQIWRSGCVAGKWVSVNLTSWQLWAFQQGVITGMIFGPGASTSKVYYGYCAGGTMAAKPYLTISYYK